MSNNSVRSHMRSNNSLRVVSNDSLKWSDLVSSDSLKWSYLVNLAPALVVVGADHSPLVQQHLGAGLVGVVGHAVVQRRQPAPVFEVWRRPQVQECLHGKSGQGHRSQQ